jgi:predicted HTH domain antitoxin
MIGRLMDNELERIWKETAVANLRYSSARPEELREITITLIQDSQSVGRVSFVVSVSLYAFSAKLDEQTQRR